MRDQDTLLALAAGLSGACANAFRAHIAMISYFGAEPSGMLCVCVCWGKTFAHNQYQVLTSSASVFAMYLSVTSVFVLSVWVLLQ